MIIWGIITARKNSKRLKDKNKLKFINKPLIEWTFTSTEDTVLDKVILSTDCEDCINIAKLYEHIDIPFIRPQHLSNDNAKSLDVIKHTINHYKNKDNINLPDYIFILQPTCPQRTKDDINYLCNYTIKNNLQGLSTYYEFKKPKTSKTLIEENNLILENGMGFIFKTELLFQEFLDKYIGSLPFNNIERLVYPKNKIIVDIDNIEEFKYAEFLIKDRIDNIERPGIKIGDRIINNNSKPFVIAEVGINHECDMTKAKKMIYDAYYSGCECVKFQCHIPEAEMTSEAKSILPGNSHDNIFNIIKSSTLTEKQEIELKNLVESLNMIYLCTPFSIDAADRLNNMGVKAFKIGSGEMNNLQLIKHVIQFKKPLLISTGMNNLQQIRNTVKLLDSYNCSYCLFHCVSIYPTPYNKVNLPAISDMFYEFPNCLIGLSDHSYGITSCLGAYMKGCSIFEKHYTSYKHWSGPDIDISITPNELKQLIEQLDILSLCKDGNGKYTIQQEEQPTINFAFCTITTTKFLEKGTVIKEEYLIAKRPNIGDFLAKDIPKLIGRKLNKDLDKDTKIFESDLI